MRHLRRYSGSTFHRVVWPLSLRNKQVFSNIPRMMRANRAFVVDDVEAGTEPG
jgi:hypothetical protein